MDDRLLCGVFGSGAPRLLAPDGREARAFVGHLGPVRRVARLSDEIFAATASDGTVRVWDLRDRFPVLSVGANGAPIVNIAGSREYLVAALYRKGIAVFDLRNAGERAVLAVANNEYEPASLCYNQHEDTLAMFGMVDGAAGRGASAAVDRDGQANQKIFRIYKGFVGIEPR
jgi:WD40 repeat protein